jgi:hypothetical protein
MRTVANVPAITRFHNKTANDIWLAGYLFIPAGQYVDFVKADFPTTNLSILGIELVQLIWQAGMEGVRADALDFYTIPGNVVIDPVNVYTAEDTDVPRGTIDATGPISRPGNPDYVAPTNIPVIANAILTSNNAYADVTFSLPVSKANGAAIAKTDFAVTFTAHGGSASGVTIASISEIPSGAVGAGEIALRFVLTVTGTPNGLEMIQIGPASGTSVYGPADSNGANRKPMPAAFKSQPMVLKGAPGILDGLLEDENAYCDVNFTQPVSKANGTALAAGDFAITFAGHGGGASNVTISSITQKDGTAMIAGLTAIRFHLTVTGTPTGSETIQVGPNSGSSVYGPADVDGVRLAMASTAKTLAMALGPAPSIAAATLVNTNVYADVTFTEGVYKSTGAALAASDFAITFAANGGTASDCTIASVTKVPTGALVGGETVIRFNLTITGTPDGSETIQIGPAGAASVYGDADELGNRVPMGDAVLSDELTLNPATAIASATIAADNTSIDVTFVNGVSKDGGDPLDLADFALTFAANGGTATGATLTAVTKTNGAPLAGGETTVRCDITVIGTPDGAETIKIGPASGTSIYGPANPDDHYLPLAASALTAAQAVSAKPVISSGLMAGDDTYVDVSFNVGVYKSAGAALAASDFALTFTQGAGTATNCVIASVTKTTGAALAGGETTVRVMLTFTGVPNGHETVEIKPASGASIYGPGSGSVRLVMAAAQTTGALSPAAKPLIVGAAIAADNSYVDVTLSVGGYKANGDPLVGGETVVRLMITVTGVVSGAETCDFAPANGASVYGPAGGAGLRMVMAGTQLATVTLNP